MITDKENTGKLKEIIRLLSEENESLSERAEDITLLSLISTKLLLQKDKNEIIDQALEQICVLKNIYYAALCRWQGDHIIIENEFSAFTNAAVAKHIEVDHHLAAKIQTLDHYSGDTRNLIQFRNDDNFSKFLWAKPYLIITESVYTVENLFLFVFDEIDENEINLIYTLLRQILNLVTLRIDNINLLEQLKHQNKDLDSKLSERTGSLEEIAGNLDRLIENSPDGILIHQNGIIRYANNALLEMLDYKYSNELIGKPVLSVVHPEDKIYANERIKKVTAGRAQSFREYRLRKKNGGYLVVEVAGIPIYREGEAAIFNTVRNITTRKLVEDDLLKQKKFLSVVMEAITNPLYVIDVRDYTIIHANKASGIDFTKGRVTCYDASHNSDVPCNSASHPCPIEELKRSKSSVVVEHVHEDWQGNKRYFEVHGYPIYDEKGNLIQAIEYNIDITERKNFEAEISVLRRGIEHLDEIVFTTDVDGVINFINPAFEKVYGYSAEEVFGKTPSIIKSGETPRSFYENFWNSLLKTKSMRGVIINKAKNGNKLYIDTVINAIENNKNEVIGYIAVQRDVTEIIENRRRLDEKEKQLVISERKFRALFEESGEGIFLLDLNGKIQSINNAACQMTGYSPDELKGRGFKDFFTREELERLPLQQNKILEGELVRIHRTLKIKNGSDLFVELTGKKVDESTMEVYIRDLTDRKEKERVLKESEERFRNMISLSPVGIVLILDGKINYTNKAFASTLGYSRFSEILNTSILEYVSDDYKDLTDEKLNLLLVEGESVDGAEIQMIRKDGSIVDVLAMGQSIEYEGKQAVQIYFFDITDRKRYEEALKFAKEKAEAADKLKSEFLAQISHEIRTPLNVINSYTGLIKDSLPSELKKELEFSFLALSKASRRIIRTVDLILNMNELELGAYDPNIEVFNLCANILEPIYREYLSEAERKGLEFSIDKKIESDLVVGDTYSIQQIFSNLIDNAIKFTRKGKVKILVNQIDKKLTVKIKDSGIGIDKDYLPELFAPFSQEESGYTRKYDGTGLGMAVVKKYCDMNKIDISVESEKEKGAEFTLVFNLG